MAETSKRKILICIDWFTPGFKAGGPIRSIVNFVDNLTGEFSTYVLTSDRDLGDEDPYDSIDTNHWLEREGYSVFYIAKSNLNWNVIVSQIQFVQPDYIYLNGLFSLRFTLFPLLMMRLGIVEGQIILAPRGMLKSSALSIKPVRKTLFLKLAKFMGLFKDVYFQATDIQDQDIRKAFGDKVRSVIIGNLPARQKEFQPVREKKVGSVRIVFIGRIHPIKNLYFLLRILSRSKSEVDLNIIAPIENQAYWEQCKSLILALPRNIRVEYRGSILPDAINSFIWNSHIFALPTSGENFGHAIFESLAAGRPVLISDQTPWKNLQEMHAGWDLALDEPDRFLEVVEMVANMTAEELNTWCLGAWDYCRDYLTKSDLKDRYKKLFI